MEYLYLVIAVLTVGALVVWGAVSLFRRLRQNLGPHKPRHRGVEKRGAIVKLDIDQSSKLPQVVVKALFVDEDGHSEWVWLLPQVVVDLRTIARSRREGYSALEDRAGQRLSEVQEEGYRLSPFHEQAEELAKQERELHKTLSLELVIHFDEDGRREIRGTANLLTVQGLVQMTSFKPED